MTSRILSSLLSLAGGTLLLSGCPDVDIPITPTTGDESTSTGDTPMTTLPMTTATMTVTEGMTDSSDTTASVDPDTTAGVTDGTTDGTTEGTTEGTTGGTTEGSSGSTGGESSSEGSSGSTGGESSSEGSSGSTGGGESSSEGSSGSTGGGMLGPGFEDCVNNPAMDVCLMDEVCVTDGAMPPGAGVCSLQDCVTAADCPESPPGGTATTTCADVTTDMINDCYLSCELGETCPTGMSCFADFVCVWDAAPAPPSGFGDCANNPEAAVCSPSEVCITDGPAMTIGVCSDQGCAVAADCPAAPPGGTATTTCADITTDMVNDCYLSCELGETCPTGMSCFGDFVCVWDAAPAPAAGFGDCGNNDPLDVCVAGEICVVDDPLAPTIAVCTDQGCAVPADCPPAPLTGTAPVLCQDITGEGTNDCILDCSAGQTCADGMTCFAGFLCAWPVL